MSEETHRHSRLTIISFVGGPDLVSASNHVCGLATTVSNRYAQGVRSGESNPAGDRKQKFYQERRTQMLGARSFCALNDPAEGHVIHHRGPRR